MSASTASSVVSFARLRDEIHVGYPRSRSSIDLSTRIVLKTNVRVRRPGPSASVIASAAVRRSVAVGVVEPRHRRLERDLLPVERDAERSELLLVES